MIFAEHTYSSAPLPGIHFLIMDFDSGFCVILTWTNPTDLKSPRRQVSRHRTQHAKASAVRRCLGISHCYNIRNCESTTWFQDTKCLSSLLIRREIDHAVGHHRRRNRWQWVDIRFHPIKTTRDSPLTLTFYILSAYEIISRVMSTPTT